MVKPAMCHIRLTGLFLAILACLSILYTPGARALAASETRSLALVESYLKAPVGSGHYAFITRGRPIKIVGKN